MSIETYSYAGDTLTVALCLLSWIFLNSTYSVRHKNLVIFYIVTFTLTGIAIENITFHYLLSLGDFTNHWLFVLENSIYCGMVGVFCWFTLYMANLFGISERTKRIMTLWAVPPLIFYTAWRLINPITNSARYLQDGEWFYYVEGKWDFLGCYIYYTIGLLLFIQYFKHRIATKMIKCIELSVCLSLMLAIGQSFIPSTTFLTVSFMFPVLAVLLLFHYHSYDAKMGSLDRMSFPLYLEDAKQKDYGIFGLELKNFIFDNNNPIALLFLQNSAEIFKYYQTFKIADNVIFVVFDKQRNLHGTLLNGVIKRKINMLFDHFRIPYKLVYMDYNRNFIQPHNYITMFETITERMDWNTFHSCDFEDVGRTVRQEQLKQIFQEIEQSEDLTHPNIKVFYQPIWDVQTKTYRSLEILSRLSCQNTLVYPDEYLSLAIKHGYLYSYNKAVFNLACQQFSELLKNDEQCPIKTISMNFSIQEFINPTFVSDILGIIDKYNIPSNKIAIEIIETTNTTQIEEVKETIWKLKVRGVQVYLDDFGTDYSNLDRIVHWPVDVVKFDKTLTWSMRDNEQLCHMIKSIVASLKEAGYKILFEGVETDSDVQCCLNMDATYLQGFKYSKPVELDQLKECLQLLKTP